MTTTPDPQRFAELLPIGHLTNARRALARYVESGPQLDAGAILDDLDEVRKLLLDAESVCATLASAARNALDPATTRAANALNSAGGCLYAAATQQLQPAVLRLLADSAVPSGVRRGAA
jgi:hypothetical protein